MSVSDRRVHRHWKDHPLGSPGLGRRRDLHRHYRAETKAIIRADRTVFAVKCASTHGGDLRRKGRAFAPAAGRMGELAADMSASLDGFAAGRTAASPGRSVTSARNLPSSPSDPGQTADLTIGIEGPDYFGIGGERPPVGGSQRLGESLGIVIDALRADEGPATGASSPTASRGPQRRSAHLLRRWGAGMRLLLRRRSGARAGDDAGLGRTRSGQPCRARESPLGLTAVCRSPGVVRSACCRTASDRACSLRGLRRFRARTEDGSAGCGRTTGEPGRPSRRRKERWVPGSG